MSRPLNATAAERIFVSLNHFLPQPNDGLDPPAVTRARKAFRIGFIAECKALGVGFTVSPAHLYTFGVSGLKDLGLLGARLFFDAQLHDDRHYARYVMEWAKDELDAAYISYLAGRASPNLGRDIGWGQTPRLVAVYASQHQRNAKDTDYCQDHYKRINGVTVAEDIIPLAIHAHNELTFNHVCAAEEAGPLRQALDANPNKVQGIAEDTLFVPVLGHEDRTTFATITQTMRDGADYVLVGDRIYNNGRAPAEWVNSCINAVEEAFKPQAEPETEAEGADA